MMFLCGASVIMVMVTLAGSSVIEDTIVISRCRAHCADQFVGLAYDRETFDERCFKQESCLECWETCAVLVTSPDSYGWMCEAEHRDTACRTGCQTSCDFTDTLEDKNGDAEESYPMTGGVLVTNDTHLYVRGHVTLPEDAYEHHVVYALLYSVRSEWKFFGASMYAEFSMRGAHRQATHLRFLVLAVTARELIAWTDPTIPRTTTPEPTTTPATYDYYDYYYYYEPETRPDMLPNLDYDDTETTTTTTSTTTKKTAATTASIIISTLATSSHPTPVMPVEQKEEVPEQSGGEVPHWRDLWQLIQPRLNAEDTLQPAVHADDTASAADQPLLTNELLLVVLGLSVLFILAMLVLSVCMLRNNMRMRRQLLELSGSSDKKDVEKGETVEKKEHSSLPWKKESSSKLMAPWQPKHRMITVDPKTMAALQLPLLHSTPRKGLKPSTDTEHRAIHLTVPPPACPDTSSDVPSILIHSDDLDDVVSTLDKSESFDVSIDPDRFFPRL